MEAIPAHVDRNYGRYAAYLGRQFSLTCDKLLTARKSERTQIWPEYRAALDACLAYVHQALQDTAHPSEGAHTLQDFRIAILDKAFATERIAQSRMRAEVHRAMRQVGERIQKLEPWQQEVAHALVLGIPIAIGVSIRGFIAGPLGIAMYALSYATSRFTNYSLKKADRNGPLWNITKWALNTEGRMHAEDALKRAYAAYTEENRNESVKRIAHALAKKRRAELVKNLRTIGFRMGTGWSAGVGTALTSSLIEHLPMGAEAATLHGHYGGATEILPTGNSGAFYDSIARSGGWFVYKNADGSYELFYYEPGKGVRHALSGVRNLGEVTEKPILEVSKKDLPLLHPADREIVSAHDKPWYERALRTLFGTNGMTEDEMRTAGIYTLTPLPDTFPKMTPDYWGRVAIALGGYTTAHPIVTELSGPGLVDRFIAAFSPGVKGLSNHQMYSLFSILFDDVQHNANLNPTGTHHLPDGREVNTMMEMSVEETRAWEEWVWDLLFGSNSSKPRARAAIDAIAEGKSDAWKAVFLGHELGHLIQHLTHADEAFNNLPAAEREQILREMHAFHEFQEKLRAQGSRTNYKGWTEEQFKLAMGGASQEDNEIFADLMSKMLTNPEEVKAHAPHFYEFMKNLINSDHKLRSVIGIQ